VHKYRDVYMYKMSSVNLAWQHCICYTHYDRREQLLSQTQTNTDKKLQKLDVHCRITGWFRRDP